MSNGTHDGAAPGTPVSAPPEPFQRLKSLLREMFQLDRGDLGSCPQTWCRSSGLGL